MTALSELDPVLDRGPDTVTPVVRVGVLGAGVVGSQVVRLLVEQADELTARVGAKLELAAVAVRRPAPPSAPAPAPSDRSARPPPPRAPPARPRS